MNSKTGTLPWVFKCKACGKEYTYHYFSLAPVCCGKPTVITERKGKESQ